MLSTRQGFLAVISSLALFAVSTSCIGEELRNTVTINDPAPSVAQIEDALFPSELVALKTECAQLEAAGLRCQSVIPKSSLDSTQITFARGSATLTGEAKQFLRAVGAALKNRMSAWKSVAIEGHTDATGTDKTNRRLSEQRAESVKQYLQTEYGLKNIETLGRSSGMLKDPENPTNAINRRIEFVPNW